MSTILVTGGAGFIGSCYVLNRVAQGDRVINLDKLTYCGNLDNLSSLKDNPLHVLVQGDIGDNERVSQLLQQYQPDAVVNFAAESHVDRSILNPDSFVQTNVLGTTALLRTVCEWWREKGERFRERFRFLHISTDEVFGSLSLEEPPFTENSNFAPNSPYSASKASSDHFVRAFRETYGLPTLVIHCSNNYGPRQFPEKLIPLVILNALSWKTLPVYGNGENVRDWLYVEDHCEVIDILLKRGRVGQSYNVGGQAERTNLEVVRSVCTLLDDLHPSKRGSYVELIQFVGDRLGHDFRYAIDFSKLTHELGWVPKYTFEQGLEKTVRWYLANSTWVSTVQNGNYRQWIDLNYGSRD